MLAPVDARANDAGPPYVKTVTVPIRSPYSDTLFVPDGVTCSGLSTPEAKVVPDDPHGTLHNVVATCPQHYKGEAVFTESIQGIARYVEYSYVDIDGQGPYEGPDRFENTLVVGCGTGDFTLYTYEGKINTTPAGFHAGPPDHPEDSYYDASNLWRVEPGSTTDDGGAFLISGSGTNKWRYYPFHEGNEESPTGTGTYEGSITCVAH